MKIATITPCLAPSRDFIKLLDASAERHDITLIPHGVGSQFVDWRHMLTEHTLPEMRRLWAEDVTHVLYVDGRDVIFVAGMTEIMQKYKKLGSPCCLISHDDQVPVVPRVNAGAYIAELDYMIRLWTELAKRHAQEGDYQQWLWREWPITGMVCDMACEVFQSVDGGVATNQGRFVNTVTGTKPCVLHFRGGYSDPVTGREYRIEPVLRALYGASV